MDAKTLIAEGRSYLGIEFGSTRIKGVVIDGDGNVLATGGHGWENRLQDGIWTYTLDDIWDGLADCYSDLCKDIKDKCIERIKTTIDGSPRLQSIIFNGKESKNRDMYLYNQITSLYI